MGREFDRHHLPRWRPEPPFLPGRTAEPEAPGARSGSTHPPTVPSGSRATTRTRNWWRCSWLGGSGAATGAVRGAARRRPAHRPQAGRQGRALPPRRQHQDLEPHAARAPGSGPRSTGGGAAAATSTAARPRHRRSGTVPVRCRARSFQRERPHPRVLQLGLFLPPSRRNCTVLGGPGAARQEHRNLGTHRRSENPQIRRVSKGACLGDAAEAAGVRAARGWETRAAVDAVRIAGSPPGRRFLGAEDPVLAIPGSC